MTELLCPLPVECRFIGVYVKRYTLGRDPEYWVYAGSSLADGDIDVAGPFMELLEAKAAADDARALRDLTRALAE